MNYYDLKSLNEAKQNGAEETTNNEEQEFVVRPRSLAEKNAGFRNYSVNKNIVMDEIPVDVRNEYASDRIARRVPFGEWVQNPIDMTAEAQTEGGKLLNGIIKAVPYFGATLVDNTAGAVASVVNAGKDAVDGDGEFNFSRSIIENPVSKAMQDFRDWSDRVLPNKRTTAELEDEDWWNHINANFIGDTFIKNLGFSGGSGAGGAVWAAAGRRALGAATRRAYRTAAASMLGEKSATDAFRKIGQGQFLKNPQKTAAALGNVVNTRNQYAAASMFIGSVAGAGGEARMEALSVADELRTPLMQEAQKRFDKGKSALAMSLINDKNYSDGKNLNEDGMKLWIDGVTELKDNYKNEVDAINYEAGRAAVNTYYPNMAVLSLSNAIMFGKMFSGGYKTQGLDKMVNGNMKKGFKERISTPKDVATIIKTPLSEGWEEMSQKIISDASSNYARHKMGDFHNKQYDNDASKDVAEYIMSYGESSANTLSDKMSWQEFAVGALTGALGMASTPTYNKNTKSLNFSSMFKNWNGGIYGAIKDIKERRKNSRDLAEKLNARIDDPDFKEYYKGLVRHMNLEYEKDMALDKRDKYVWHNKDFEQLLSDIIMFDKAGRLDEFKETVTAFANISDEDAQKMAELFNTDGSFNPSALAKMKQNLKKNAKKVSDMIDDYSAMYNAIDYLSLGTTDPIVIEELMYTAMQLKNFESRYKDLANNVIDRITPVLQQEAEEVDENGNPTKSANTASNILKNKNNIITLFGGIIDESRANDIKGFFAPSALDKIRTKNIMDWLKAIGALDVDNTIKKDIEDLQKLIRSRNSFYNTLFDPTFRFKAAPKSSPDAAVDNGNNDIDDVDADVDANNNDNTTGTGNTSGNPTGLGDIIYDEDGNPIILNPIAKAMGESSDDSQKSGEEAQSKGQTGETGETGEAGENAPGGTTGTAGETAPGESGGSALTDNPNTPTFNELNEASKKKVLNAFSDMMKDNTISSFWDKYKKALGNLILKERDALSELIDANERAKYMNDTADSAMRTIRAVETNIALNCDMFSSKMLDDVLNAGEILDYCDGSKNVDRAVCNWIYKHLPKDEDSNDAANAIIGVLNETLGEDAYKFRGEDGRPKTDEEAAEEQVDDMNKKEVDEAFDALKNATTLSEFAEVINNAIDKLGRESKENADLMTRIREDEDVNKMFQIYSQPILLLTNIYTSLASARRVNAATIIASMMTYDGMMSIYEAYDKTGDDIIGLTYDYIAASFPQGEEFDNDYNLVGKIVQDDYRARYLSARAGKVDEDSKAPSFSSDSTPVKDGKNHIYVSCRDAKNNKVKIDIAGNTKLTDYTPTNGEVDRDYTAKAIAEINKITAWDSIRLEHFQNQLWIRNNVNANISMRDMDEITGAAAYRAKAIKDSNDKGFYSIDEEERRKAIEEEEARLAKERSDEFRKRDVFCINCDKYRPYDPDKLKNNIATYSDESNPRVLSILKWKQDHNVQEVVDSGFLHDIQSAVRDEKMNYGADICFIANPHLSAKNPFAKEYDDKDNKFNNRQCEIVLAVDVTNRFESGRDRYVKNGIITNETVIEIDGRKYQPIGIMSNPYIDPKNKDISDEVKELYANNAKKLANIVYDVTITGVKGTSDASSIMTQYMNDVAAKVPIPDDGKWYVAKTNKTKASPNGEVIHTSFGYIMPGRRMRGVKMHSLRDVVMGAVYGKNESGNGKYIDDFRFCIKKLGQDDTLLDPKFREGAIGIEITEPNGATYIEYVTVPTFKEYDFKLNDNTRIVTDIKAAFEKIVNPDSTHEDKISALGDLHGMIWCKDSPLLISGNSVVVNGIACNTIDEFINACADSSFRFSVTNENIYHMYQSNVLLTDMRTFVNKGASFAITGIDKKSANPIQFRVEQNIRFSPGSGSISSTDKKVVFGQHNYGVDEDGVVYRIEAGDHVYDNLTPTEVNTVLAVAYVNGKELDNVEGYTCPFKLESDKRTTHWLVKMKVGGDIIRLHIRETGSDIKNKDGEVVAPGHRVTFVVNDKRSWENLVDAARNAGNTWENNVMRANDYSDFFSLEGGYEFEAYDKPVNDIFIDEETEREAKSRRKQDLEDMKKKNYEKAVSDMKEAVARAGEDKSDSQSRIDDIYKRYVDMGLSIDDAVKCKKELGISREEYKDLCKYVRTLNSKRRKERENMSNEQRDIIDDDDWFC